jgi:TetR/AcrR family transcriptional regulator
VATRRAPDPAQRRRDPERARERLLDAAAEEFGAKGFAGARVKRIAERAGLNQQLISYYFGGKAGLYEALQRRWQDTSRELGGPELALEDVAVNFLRASTANRAWTRLLVWQGLADGGADQPGADAGLMRSMVADIRRRQASGELAEDLDPAHVALALFAAAAAPAVLPHVARAVTGLDPASEEFQRAYGTALARIVRRLRG